MPTKLPEKIFLQSFSLAPRVALNLVITNNNNEILLTKRLKPPFENTWHFPGSFLLKDETLNDCLKRIAQEELGTEFNENEINLLGVFEDLNGDPRGHVIDIMYGYQGKDITLRPINDTKEMQFFSHLPEAMGFNHKETLKKLGYK